MSLMVCYMVSGMITVVFVFASSFGGFAPNVKKMRKTKQMPMPTLQIRLSKDVNLQLTLSDLPVD